jgi:hypothetical protein
VHSIKDNKTPMVFWKIDLAKAYNKVCWMYLRLLLIHIGMNVHMENWIMVFLSLSYFIVLIKISPSIFFYASKGIGKGCPMSHFLFILLAEGLSKLISKEKRE